MQNISRKMVNVAELPLKLDLQLFADDDDNTPNLEDTPEFKEDIKEFKEMDAKLDKFTKEREAKQPVKEKPAEKVVEVKDPVKEEVKAVTEEVATPDPKPKQDAETNKAFQEQRKAREDAEAKALALEEKANRADALIKAQFGEQGINTVEQYEQWIKDGEEQKETDRLKEAGLTDKEIEKLRRADEREAEETVKQQEEYKKNYIAGWQQLYDAYPDETKDNNLFTEGKDPSFYTEAMKAEIARGASPLAAYRNAHFETILANTLKGAKESAKQEALNQLNSKDHIKANGSEGADVDHIEIDPEQMNIYRKLMKGKSDTEIRKFAKKQLSGG